jgi:hypothetical protein
MKIRPQVTQNRIFMTRVSNLLLFHLAIPLKIWLGVFLLMVIYLWDKVVFGLWFAARVFSFTWKTNKRYVVSEMFS